ncbi:MAG: 50S ribosomal protein L29 [Candidatus Marinimicrobia bacterium]|nr:50S ribosomal protein L29 [Candidatus Neomarinimicrobiota bacterium]MCK9482911.1 50S ribosomal protein L29 [Candidatus Neomarinimicrobiota bacterium]MCK9559463.1 50S ribosomal protein L29 [Candidatus Neomarinimicrobiota bacterium]MDD5060736.1 50S ribosomal protein L29 [Candidatus Neomarinimicrobiota bacterium]MDD5229933.1 50S ribosomal protein L29 [Candidatus Neomarinimicrobiota bacterium]
MKTSTLRELSPSELETKLRDNLAALENLRFQKALQQLENPLKIRLVKREIAQIRTVLHEYEMGVRTQNKQANKSQGNQE